MGMISIGAWANLLLVCSTILIASCGVQTETELARITSPDKKVVALLLQVDPGGGATVAFTTYVYLNKGCEDVLRHANFEGYSCGPVSIDWKDNKTLQIVYYAGCHIRTFDNQWWARSGGESPREVELVLKRDDVPGWPGR